MKRFLQRIKQDRRGQGMVEYALIIALVAIVVIAALALLGPRIASVFTQTDEELEKVVSSSAITMTQEIAQN